MVPIFDWLMMSFLSMHALKKDFRFSIKESKHTFKHSTVELEWRLGNFICRYRHSHITPRIISADYKECNACLALRSSSSRGRQKVLLNIAGWWWVVDIFIALVFNSLIRELYERNRLMLRYYECFPYIIISLYHLVFKY